MAKKVSKPPPTANGVATASAIYFLSLSLENVRCFREKQTLDLSDGKGGPARWTILLGNNGTGKTTVLQALAVVAWPLEMPGVDPLLAGYYEPSEWETFPREGQAANLLFSMTEGAILTTPHPNWVSNEREMSKRRGERWSPLKIHKSSPTPPLERMVRPLCCAYGAGRRLGPKAEETALGAWSASKQQTRTLFEDWASLRDTEQWLLQLDYSASKESPSQVRQREWREHVWRLFREKKLLPEIDDIRCIAGEGPTPIPRVEFRTPYGWVALRGLGYGYQTLIAWVVDLASRMVERYPNSTDPLAEPAIVLVDEIDLHLHPQWQRQLIGYLTERFPNTQFIVTAHSPLVVQAATDANLAVLRREGDQVVIDNDVEAIRGWRIDQIYTSELFGLPSARPPELDSLLARRQELLARAKLTARDEKELKELEERIGYLPGGETAEQNEMLRLLRRSLEVLQKERPK